MALWILALLAASAFCRANDQASAAALHDGPKRRQLQPYMIWDHPCPEKLSGVAIGGCGIIPEPAAQTVAALGGADPMLQPGSRWRVTHSLVAAGHRADLPDPDQQATVH